MMETTSPNNNVVQEKNNDSLAVLRDPPEKKDGEVEVAFLYEGQNNVSVVLRTNEAAAYTVTYNGDSQWIIEQPEAKWSINISGPTLVSGESYQLLFGCARKDSQDYLDNQLFNENADARNPHSTRINEYSLRKVCIQLVGHQITLNISQIEKRKLSEEQEQQMIAMRKKWQKNIVGDFETDPSLLKDPDIAAYIKSLSQEATEVYTAMDKRPERTRLWPRVPTDTNSADMRTQFMMLTVLAKAYGTRGTVYYKDAVVLKEAVRGLDFMCDSGCYSGANYLGNWWDFQIGIPQEFITILMALCNEVAPEKVARYVQILYSYLPDPYKQLHEQIQDIFVPLEFLVNFTNSGANRIDQAISYLGMGLLINDSEMVQTAVESIQDSFQIVTKDDGFYQDGSFIQHHDIPYTGAYGNILVKGVADILTIVDQTNWQLPDAIVTQFVSNVQKAFLPVIVNGETMSFINGRSITRCPTEKNQVIASKTTYNLLITAEFAKGEPKYILQQAAKHWMVQDLPYYYRNIRDFKDLLLTKKVLANSAIDATTIPFLGSRMYGAMDRYVYTNAKIKVGISLYSSRISAFEAGNHENKKGWHLSDGMVYLYNKDPQFGSTYWPTVDWYRLPGTTVDTTPLQDELTPFLSFRSPAAFVGGATDGNNATVAMQLDKTGWVNNRETTIMNLQAKKSWFVLDGIIIALGAGINGTTTGSLETVIENRLLDPQSIYTFTNQSGSAVKNVAELHVAANDWFLLNSSRQNQSIGYVMLEDQVVQAHQTEHTGTYKEINDSFPSDKMYTGTYQQLIVQHGKEVTDAHYAYVIYPDATAEQLISHVNEQPYTILNTAKIQAVKETRKHLLGATIWQETGVTIDGLHVNKPVTFLYQRQDDQHITLSLSNPKQTNEVIEVTLPDELEEVVTQDEGITVKENRTLVIDTTGGLGKTYQLNAKVKLTPIPDPSNVQSLEVGKKECNLPLRRLLCKKRKQQISN